MLGIWACSCVALFSSIRQNDVINTCNAGKNICWIMSNGDICACMGYPSVGNIYNDNFKDIWHNSPALDKIRSAKLDNLNSGKCKVCDMQIICKKCPATLYINGSMLFGVNSRLCEETKILYELSTPIKDSYYKKEVNKMEKKQAYETPEIKVEKLEDLVQALCYKQFSDWFV